ncbi:alpha/beta hydrolase [Spongiactinospora sp. TRM90649]|uniref:alpha/beta fold hydrolase n=1 Tax=Spongiactinospora sp. TRM90649 TaxID=3031114 RepID=UPI0023FA2A94|nr:alpha/beta hydrolase [Spongiactinospora sp. TRM90649]MDF5754654.1 alpha/beta hydrolase [Spongiactinospora sp. TRM90649]
MPGVVRTAAVTSADGTRIAYDRYGSGPALILVNGAFTGREHPVLAGVAAALAPWFTVVNYDRRGRGDSGDTLPYAVQREVEDLAALIAEVGGTAMVFGGSSGGALALTAALCDPAITRVAVWEPPYHVDASAPYLPDDFAARLTALVDEGRPADAVEVFMVRAAEVPAEAVAAMRGEPFWAAAEAIARTLAYEAAVLGPGNALPGGLAAVRQPTLVLNGAESAAWMTSAGRAVAALIPGASHRVLPGQAHNVSAEALAPELLEFFAG